MVTRIGNRILQGAFLFLLVLVAVLLFSGRAREIFLGGAGRPGGGGTEKPSIVLVVIDTARQDRLSCYGYARETTPRLRGLAKSSTSFRNAHSTSSWTAPAHASLFTGLYPVAHGTTQENWRMGGDLVTLAEVLLASGYRTIGIVENAVLRKRLGYAQGFNMYYETWRTAGNRSDRFATLDRFRKSLNGVLPGEPFFLFVNLIGPHNPYDSSGPFRSRFVSDPSIPIVANQWTHYYLGNRDLSDEELRHLGELYDAELLYCDSLVGGMIDELKERDLWEDATFVVTSDHGENLGENGHLDHVFTLYETTTKVPLLIRSPGLFGEGEWSDLPVQLTDLFPTLLGIAGVERGKHPSHGYDLTAERPGPDRPILCEYYYPDFTISGYQRAEDKADPDLSRYKRRIRSLLAGGMKLIWGSDGRHELYDLARDPLERRNLADDPAHRGERVRLEKELTSILERSAIEGRELPEKPRGAIDRETKEALRSLGYVE